MSNVYINSITVLEFMKALTETTILFIIVLLCTSVFIAAVPEIQIKPEGAEHNVGDIFKVKIVVTIIHKKCPLPITSTVIELSKNLMLVNETEWIQVSSNVYEKTIWVKCVSEGEGTIRVYRKCPIYGLIEAQVKIGVGVKVEETAEAKIYWHIPNTVYILLTLTAVSVFLAFTLAKRRDRRSNMIRLGVLAFSLALLGFVKGGCPCPIGAVQIIPVLLLDMKIYIGWILLLLIPIIATLIFGRIYCGWICPFGALQELIGLINKRKIKPPSSLNYIKLLSLAVFIGLSISIGDEVFREYDPFKALFNLSFTETTLALLIIVVLASILIGRPFCKYICPLGAILMLVDKVSILRIRRDSKLCINCSLCRRICPYNTDSGTGKGECILCLKCITKCLR